MGEFKQGFCGCFDNCGLCIFTYFCPCIVWGQTAEKVLSWFWVIQSYFTCRLPSRVSMSSANFVDARNYESSISSVTLLQCAHACMYMQVGESCFLCGFCLLVPIGDCVSVVQIRGKVREQHGIEVTSRSPCHTVVLLSSYQVTSIELRFRISESAPIISVKLDIPTHKFKSVSLRRV